MTFIGLLIGSYLLGAVPFGMIIAAAHGIDLRKVGSGNIGATNLSRALGKNWGYFCFALDAAKGLVPMLIAKTFLVSSPAVADLFLWLACGLAAILGHIFPIYLRFKGGKGVATSFGVALGLYPYYTIPAILAFAVWLIVFLIWRYVSLASIIAALVFPLTLLLGIVFVGTWNFASLWPLIIAAAAIPLMVILRHRQNISRLLSGTENKI
jgi:acyl phosphate:glycerol-3-phosphate acyltransferase